MDCHRVTAQANAGVVLPMQLPRVKARGSAPNSPPVRPGEHRQGFLGRGEGENRETSERSGPLAVEGTGRHGLQGCALPRCCCRRGTRTSEPTGGVVVVIVCPGLGWAFHLSRSGGEPHPPASPAGLNRGGLDLDRFRHRQISAVRLRPPQRPAGVPPARRAGHRNRLSSTEVCRAGTCDGLPRRSPASCCWRSLR